MANISDDQLDQLNRNLSQLSGTMGSMAAKLSADSKGRKEANDILRSDTKSRASLGERVKNVDDRLNKTADSMRVAGSSADEFARSMRDAARYIPGGFLMSELLHYTTATVGTYKEMTKYGQTFGGSMVNMSMAAGAAGLSLADYANAVKSNSKVVATLGQGFFAINKDVRRAAEGMGLYGMSLDEMNNFSGSYLEQQRLTGALTKAGQTRQVKAIGELAVSVGGLAKITGVATDQIMEIAQGAMRDPALVAAMSGNTARGMHAYNDQINQAVTQLAAQAGPAGKFLSEGLAQTIAMGGTQFTEQANTMMEAGFSEGALAFQQAADKLARGVDADQVSMELTNSLKQMADNPGTREALLNQARAGNAQARQILEITQNMKTYTRAEMEAAKLATKRKDVMTGFATAFESIFSSLKGSLVEGFLKPFGLALDGTNFERTLENLKDIFKPLESTFSEMGESWGKGLKTLLTGDNLKNFGDGLVGATKSFIQLFKIVFTKENMDSAMAVFRLIADLGLIISGFTMGVIVPILGAVADGMNTLKGGIEGLMKFLSFDEKTSKTAAGIITGGLLIAAGLGLKLVFSKIAERFLGLRLQSVAINAGRVIVNGGMGGSGGGGDMGGDMGGEGGRRGGRQDAHVRARNRHIRANRGGMRGLLGRAANMAEDVGTTASRQAGRFIPRGLRGAARGAGRFLGRAGVPLALGMTAIDQFGMMNSLGEQLKNGEITKAQHDRQMAQGTGGNAGGLLGGLAAGAAAGAAGGALFGGVGAIPGAIIGGGIGAIGGSSAGRWLGGKWNDWRSGGQNPANPQQRTAPSNPQTQQIDTQGQSDRMAAANRAAGQERSLENLLAEMRRMNTTLDEGRQISTAQLERQIEQNNIARGTTTALQNGQR